MSFTLTTSQMYEETKDVTRRLGWWNLKTGDVVMAVEKGMGLKKDEKVKKIYPIQIISASPEPLNSISAAEVVREGFPQFSIRDFITMFVKSHKGCEPDTLVNRIEFRRLRELEKVKCDIARECYFGQEGCCLRDGVCR